MPGHLQRIAAVLDADLTAVVESGAGVTIMAAKLVLLSVANHAGRGDDGTPEGVCSAGIETIASEVGGSRRTVQRALKLLEDADVLVRSQEPGKAVWIRPNWTRIWSLSRFSGGCQIVTTTRDTGVTPPVPDCHRGGDMGGDMGGDKCDIALKEEREEREELRAGAPARVRGADGRPAASSRAAAELERERIDREVRQLDLAIDGMSDTDRTLLRHSALAGLSPAYVERLTDQAVRRLMRGEMARRRAAGGAA